MNKTNKLYNEYLSISNNWELDDWSITKECFDHIIRIVPFGKTILEIGSGNSTRLLSKFYKMISIESNKEWMNKYDSEYKYVPIKEIQSTTFNKTKWLDVELLTKALASTNNYDLLLVDAGGDRIGIYDYIHLFQSNIPIIFDDTMSEKYLNCAEMLAKKLKKSIETFQCKKNKYCTTWFNGKKYSVIY